MTSAVYKISNMENEKFYVGSAVNYEGRKSAHLSSLRKGTHSNDHLQRAFNKYGEESFVFELVEIVEDKNNLIKREQFWIDNFDFDELYNINHIAGSALGLKHTDEAKMKMSLARSGKKLSPEHKEKISNAQKNQPAEMREILRKANIGNKYTLGFKHSDETRLKVGKAHQKSVIQIDRNTDEPIKIWDSIKEAAEVIGVSDGNISRVCRKTPRYKKNKPYICSTAGGYKWAFA